MQHCIKKTDRHNVVKITNILGIINYVPKMLRESAVTLALSALTHEKT